VAKTDKYLETEYFSENNKEDCDTAFSAVQLEPDNTEVKDANLVASRQPYDDPESVTEGECPYKPTFKPILGKSGISSKSTWLRDLNNHLKPGADCHLHV
jgi:hypothetical protein